MQYDFFEANLPSIISNGTKTSEVYVVMPTLIQCDPQGTYLRIGDHLDIKLYRDNRIGYLTIRSPANPLFIRLLELWTCEEFGPTLNWAEIVIENNIIISIVTVPLTIETLERVNYINEELIFYYETITGLPLFISKKDSFEHESNFIRSDWIERLKEKL